MSSLVITLFPRPARERLPRLSSLRISRLRHQQHRCRLSQIPARVFFRVCGEYIRRVKYWQIMMVILATLSASIVLADDFKTIKGKEFKDVTVSRVEPDGIVLKTKSGISKVYFTELPKEIQERFLPSPAKTVAAPRERQLI